jgi:PmbA protein
MEKEFKEAVRYGLCKGFDETEIYFSETGKLEIGVYEGRADKFSRSRIKGTAFRGIKGGKTGFSFTENSGLASLKRAADSAYENMTYIDSEDESRICASGDIYVKYDPAGDSFAKTGIDAKIKMLLDMEKYIFGRCDRVHKISHLLYTELNNKEKIVNSLGLDLSEIRTQGYLYVDIVIRDGDKFRSGSAYMAGMDFNDLDPNDVAVRALDDGLSKTGAQSINTGMYKVIFRNTAFADLLSSFSGIFSADKVQKGTSKLSGMLGKSIGSGILTVIDDPGMEGGLSNAAFDGEGTKTQRKEVISEGILKTYLYNIKTAIKDGVKSTGNAGRQSYRSGIGTSVYNFYVIPGKTTLAEGLRDIGSGVFITDLQGLHAGVDPISCDFSLSAQGFMIENGTVGCPVSDITLSGNFLELIKDIKDVFTDLDFTLPSGGYFGSPSVSVGSLSIAGEKGPL